MLLVEGDLETIMESIWDSILGLPLRRADAASCDLRPRSLVTGCVLITGAWQGAMTVECSAALARRIASVLFGIDPGRATEEDVQDALGEIANMAGGNVKSLLPAPSAISLPAVAEGNDYRMGVPGGRSVSRASFTCEGEPLLVTLIERDDEAWPPAPRVEAARSSGRGKESR